MGAGLAKRPIDSSTGRRSFTAGHPGTCASCPAAVLPGDKIFYAVGNEAPSGLDCCGDRPDIELMVIQVPELDVGAVDDDRIDLTAVMPRGRTALDMCPNGCFQIPSSNGTCGC